MPIDNPVLPSYLLNIPNPAETLQKSLQAGLQIGQAQQTAQAAQDAHAAAQQAQQLGGIQIQGAQQTVDANAIAQQRSLALRKAWADESQNPTPQGMTRIITQFPEAADMVQKAGGVLDEQQVKQLTPIYSALITKHYDIAKSEIEKAATAWDDPKNGNKQKAQQLRDMSSRLDADPDGVTMHTAAALATAMGPKTFGDSFGKLLGIQTAQQKAESDALKAQQDQIAGAPAAAGAGPAYDLAQRTAKLAADQAAQTLTTLPEKVQESVKAKTDEAYQATNLSGKLGYLIAKGDSLVNSGKLSHGADLVKDLYGGQTAADNFRNQVEGFKGSSVLSAMSGAGGKGSEGIISLGQEGQPGKYDDWKASVRPYLQRLKDAADKAAPLARDMARWETLSRGVQRAPTDFALPSGRKVKAGDFYDSMAKAALPVTQDTPAVSEPSATAPETFTTAQQARHAELLRRRQLNAAKTTNPDNPGGDVLGYRKF